MHLQLGTEQMQPQCKTNMARATDQDGLGKNVCDIRRISASTLANQQQMIQEKLIKNMFVGNPTSQEPRWKTLSWHKVIGFNHSATFNSWIALPRHRNEKKETD